MKIGQAITEANMICPNTYDDALKVKWLSRCEALIYRNIIRMYETEIVQASDDDEETGPAYLDENGEWRGYYPGIDLDTELLAQEPFDEIYVYYLLAQIHFSNDEITKYNNCISMYNAGYSDYQKDYARTHTRKAGGRRFLF